MSNALAIAAVTATLRNLLTQAVTMHPELGDTTVTAQPPDVARANGSNGNQINLFLYHTLPNAAWRNMDMPAQVKSGESGTPPLALNLYYLLTMYGRDNDLKRPYSQDLLGHAMLALHDHPLLGADEIRTSLPNNDLHLQVERIRFALQPISLEELFKLWAGFQTPYRHSVAYEVTVVLIDSTRATKAPLPVLTRGPKDSGIIALGSLTPPFPEIEAIEPPKNQRSAQLGDVLTIKGHHLSGDSVRVLFSNLRLPAPIALTPQPGSTADELSVKIDDAPTKWVAGTYSVSVEVTQRPGKPDQRVQASGGVAFSLAPTLKDAFPFPAALVAGSATINLKVSPQVGPEQSVALVIGDRQLSAEPRTKPTALVTFQLRDASQGEFFIRLRVEGVDSLLVDDSDKLPVPIFKNHKLRLT